MQPLQLALDCSAILLKLRKPRLLTSTYGLIIAILVTFDKLATY